MELDLPVACVACECIGPQNADGGLGGHSLRWYGVNEVRRLYSPATCPNCKQCGKVFGETRKLEMHMHSFRHRSEPFRYVLFATHWHGHWPTGLHLNKHVEIIFQYKRVWITPNITNVFVSRNHKGWSSGQAKVSIFRTMHNKRGCKSTSLFKTT